MKFPNPRPGTSVLPPGFAMTQRDTDKHDLTKRVGLAVPAGRLPFAPSCPSLPSLRPPSQSAKSAPSAVTSPDNSVPASPARTPQSSQMTQSVPTHSEHIFPPFSTIKPSTPWREGPLPHRRRSMLDHRNTIFAMPEPFYFLTRYDT